MLHFDDSGVKAEDGVGYSKSVIKEAVMSPTAKLLIAPWLCAVLALPVSAASFTLSKPDEVGFSAERLKVIHSVIQKHIDAKDFTGAVTLVARKGKVVHFEAQGAIDQESGKPMRTDTLFRMASMTKPITAVAVLMLMEEGKLVLSDPVSKFIPEFRNPKVAMWNLPNDPRGAGVRIVSADREVTLQHILTHTAGLAVSPEGPAGDFYRNANLAQGQMSLAEFCKRVGTLPLNFQPGTQWQYTSGVGFAVLGRVVEIVSGMNLDQFFKQRIFAPLNMSNTFFNIPANRMGDVATVYRRTEQGLVKQNPAPPLPAGVEFFSGAGGLTGSAEDYLQFCQMLLNGGQWNGARLLSRKTVELMTDNAIGNLDLANYSEQGLTLEQNLRGYGFGLGVRVRKSTGASGWLGSPGDYGWAGANGTYFWVDPKEQLIGMVLMATRVGILRTEFPNAVYQALVD
jgi:CubicO group peptidase (beta-lactamase class C family)